MHRVVLVNQSEQTGLREGGALKRQALKRKMKVRIYSDGEDKKSFFIYFNGKKLKIFLVLSV